MPDFVTRMVGCRKPGVRVLHLTGLRYVARAEESRTRFIYILLQIIKILNIRPRQLPAATVNGLLDLKHECVMSQDPW